MPFLTEILELVTAGLVLATAMPLFKKTFVFEGTPLIGELVRVEAK